MRSGQVPVRPAVVLLALEVVALDEALDALFDERWGGREPSRKLARNLRDELVVLQLLSGLHFISAKKGAQWSSQDEKMV